MGRQSDARERILTTAERLFRSRGFTAVGVAEVCTGASVPKGSFYYFFSSKTDLALAVIDEHWATQRTTWAATLGGEAPPLDRLGALFTATAAYQREAQHGTGSVTGCLFGNLALELSTQDELIRGRLQAIFEEQIDLVEAVVGEAMAHGFATVTDSREAARGIVAQVEGMVMLAKLLNDPSRLDSLWHQSLLLLGAPSARSAR